jgi:hypothetical protein
MWELGTVAFRAPSVKPDWLKSSQNEKDSICKKKQIGIFFEYLAD